MNGEPMQEACANVPGITSALRRQSEFIQNARRWWRRIMRFRLRAPRRLHLCESLPLGDRRFVALVECEGSRFLLGGTSTSLVLLARLEGQTPTGRTTAANQSIDGNEEAH